MNVSSIKILVGLVLTAGLLLALADRSEAARGWAGGNSVNWSSQKTCVNGALIMGLHAGSTSLDWDPSTSGSSPRRIIQPYLLDRRPADAVTESLMVILPDGTEINENRDLFFQGQASGSEIFLYQRVVGTPTAFEIQKESMPFRTTFSGDELRSFYGYLTGGSLYFHQDLTVGDLVYYSVGVIDTVKDCRIDEKSSVTNTFIDLPNPASGIIPDDRLVYTVEQSADSGSLEVGSIVQSDGQTFTAKDLISQPLVFSGIGGTQSVQISSQATYRVSVNGPTNGEIGQLTGRSWEPTISGDGTVVAFTSNATDVEGVSDTNGASDVFRRRSFGLQPISEVFTRTAANELGNGISFSPDISPDGKFIAFTSNAKNLAQTTNCTSNFNIFIVRETGNAAQMSCDMSEGWAGDSTRPTAGAGKPTLHDFADGSAEQSEVVYQTHLTVPFVFFDDNNQPDIVGINTTPNVFTSVTVSNNDPFFPQSFTYTGNGGSRNPQISHDGKHVVFESDASNLASNDTNNETDIIVYSNGVRRRMTLNSAGEEANSFSISPAISRFGEHVTFASAASNLTPNTDAFLFQVYVRDRNIDKDENYDEDEDSCTVLISKSNGGLVGNDNSTGSSISADGRFIAFVSRADNLVDGDLPTDGVNGFWDIFVHDRDADGDGSFYSDSSEDERCTPGPYQTIRVSVDSYGIPGDANSTGKPDISANGEFVAFASDATNLVPRDTNGVTDVFVHYLGFTVDLRFSEPPTPPTYTIYLPFALR